MESFLHTQLKCFYRDIPKFINTITTKFESIMDHWLCFTVMDIK